MKKENDTRVNDATRARTNDATNRSISHSFYNAWMDWHVKQARLPTDGHVARTIAITKINTRLLKSGAQ